MKRSPWKRWTALVLCLCALAGLSALPAAALGDTGASVSWGTSHGLALKKDGTLWAWGDNALGQLGTGTAGGSRSRPVQVLTQVRQVSAGGNFSLALRTDGTLWAWGDNTCGQLGTGAAGGVQPKPVQVLDQVVCISAGSRHGAAVRSDGTLWTWGDNTWGQLGTGKSGGTSGVFDQGVDEAAPVRVLEGAAAVCAGPGRTMAIKTDATLWAWGSGMLGDGSTQGRTQPVQVLDQVTAVCLGGSHTLAIRSDHSLWGWGSNFLGQMGKGSATDSGYRSPVKLMDNVVWASAEERFSLAVKSDGTLWTWGDMMWGTAQSDNVITESDCIPVQILDGVAQAAAGAARAAAVKTDGTLWTWGSGRQGELGDGQTAPDGQSHYNMTPAQVLSGVSPSPDQILPADPEDIPSDWARAQVERAVAAGIVPGSLQGRYTRAVTRGEFCALGVALYEKVTGAPIPGRQKFQDTQDVNVEKLASLGVVSGVGDGRFAPDQLLTREQAAVMLAQLARALGKPLEACETTFRDRAQIASWALGAVGQVQGAGVMSGTGNDRFSPAGTYTREQSILTMQRLLERAEG